MRPRRRAPARPGDALRPGRSGSGPGTGRDGGPGRRRGPLRHRSHHRPGSGADRFQTAAAAALRFGSEPVGTIAGERVAIVASGRSFPDALAAGPLAHGANLPLMLSDTNMLTVGTVSALSQLNIDRIVVVGGEAVLPDDETLRTSLQVGVGDVAITRIAGPNRYSTAAQVADFALAQLGWDPDLTLVATGVNFPDALAASAHGGVTQSPLPLVEPQAVGTAAGGWLTAACPRVEVIRALGGTQAVSASVLSQAVAAAEACG
jgi:minor extracellular serine protease Vpr